MYNILNSLWSCFKFLGTYLFLSEISYLHWVSVRTTITNLCILDVYKSSIWDDNIVEDVMVFHFNIIAAFVMLWQWNCLISLCYVQELAIPFWIPPLEDQCPDLWTSVDDFSIKYCIFISRCLNNPARDFHANYWHCYKPSGCY